MSDEIRPIDGLITIPRAARRGDTSFTAREAIEAEKDAGRGGLMALSQERRTDRMT